MVELLTVILVLVLVLLGLAIVLILKANAHSRGSAPDPRLDALLVETKASGQIAREELAALRRENLEQAGALREELARRIDANQQAMLGRLDENRRDAQTQTETTRRALDTRLAEAREAAEKSLAATRAESRQLSTDFQAAIKQVLTETQQGQSRELADFSQRLRELNVVVTEQLDKIRQTMEQRITELQNQNATKLDEMRQTVDQRLQATLEQRLSESFKIVSESLERVTHGLGEMQNIAAGVGDLKKVLTNVKTRGTWSEFQLAALLEQMLTPEQYASNVAPNPGSTERVEFAVKLPGRDAGEKPVWLPIDAKFPVEDYQRLMEATEKGDVEGVTSAGNALETRLRGAAKDIATKYIALPYTTDFAILYLPTEGLYAEALRRPGLAETIQNQHRILIAGPMTLAALLNSLQMGFRTVAIQQRSSEVWKVLGAVKSEFAKFGDVLAKVKQKLDEASSQIDQTGVRSRAIERRLRSVETLPAAEVAQLLPDIIETNGAGHETPAPEAGTPADLAQRKLEL